MFRVKYEFKKYALEEFLIAMKEFGRNSVAVGVIGSDALQKHPTANITVGEIAAINEYGTGHIPPRPFIRQTFANRMWVRDVLVEAARSVINGRSTVTSALNRAGGLLADGIRNTLLDGVGPANAEATVDWKGHGDTLIGLTGALYDAITHKVVPKV